MTYNQYRDTLASDDLLAISCNRPRTFYGFDSDKVVDMFGVVAWIVIKT